MTLRQQFDDIMNRVADISLMEEEDEFVETVLGSMKIKDETRCLNEKLYRLKKSVAKKERQRVKLHLKVMNESARLEKEKKKREAAEEEKAALEDALEAIRSVVLRPNATNVDVLSLIESASSQESVAEET